MNITSIVTHMITILLFVTWGPCPRGPRCGRSPLADTTSASGLITK